LKKGYLSNKRKDKEQSEYTVKVKRSLKREECNANVVFLNNFITNAKYKLH